MPIEQCEMALRQTQELLRLTEGTLQGICCRSYRNGELYAEALSKVLGGKGKRGPACILVVFQHGDRRLAQGRVFHLVADELVEGSEEVSIDPGSSYGVGLALAEAGGDVVAVNWDERCADVETFQSQFPDAVHRYVGGAIRNFVTGRISGELAGVITGFNYPGKATDYD